jgi:hypothetical protein
VFFNDKYKANNMAHFASLNLKIESDINRYAAGKRKFYRGESKCM